MKEREFVMEGIKRVQIEEYLRDLFERAGYSHCEIQRTPLGLRVAVYAARPGIVIGRRGRNIDRIIEDLKKKFGLDNVNLDVREVEVPELDAQVVAREIARALERGINFRKVANVMLRRVMEHAAGCMIKISGKLSGEIARTEKFYAGYLKYAGEYVESLVRIGKARANLKPGVIGIEVRILPELPKEMKIEKEREEEKVESVEKIEEKEEKENGVDKEERTEENVS